MIRPSRPHFLPLTPLVFFFLFVLLGFLLLMMALDVLRFTYEKLGLAPHTALLLLLGSLVGSYINIPLATLPGERTASGQRIMVFGVPYIIPVVHDWPRTILAVNVGGAVIPTVLSVYLLLRYGLYGPGLLGTAFVTLVVYWMARPVQGVGIVVPIFLPPLIAAGVGLLLAPQTAPALAYIAGSLGTLLGADLFNLRTVRGLGAPIASIGGSGTFDGIFLTGVLAVLLAS
ncbi:MAG: DUF1614 domain-containing protein [Candidatus Tectimicrobiota bacterium]